MSRFIPSASERAIAEMTSEAIEGIAEHALRMFYAARSSPYRAGCILAMVLVAVAVKHAAVGARACGIFPSRLRWLAGCADAYDAVIPAVTQIPTETLSDEQPPQPTTQEVGHA